MYGIVLITVLVITGGAVAFIGDRLGTKVGKKKLSIFGLRPRHTSIIVTIITGILITTLTFGIMAAVSKDVRTALFGLETLNKKIQQTQGNLQNATIQLAAANAEQKQTDEDLAKTKSEVDTLKKTQDELTNRNAALEAGNADLESKNKDLTASNADLVGSNETLSSQNTNLANQNDTLQQSNTVLNDDNKILEKHNADLRNGLQFVREGAIIYRAGEVIAGGLVNKSNEDKTINADLASIIYLANRNITERMGLKSPVEGVWISQKEFETAFNTIKTSQQELVVRIVAAGNLIYGEPVRAHIMIYKNNMIYKDSEFIFSEKFKMTGPGSQEAEQMLVGFLKNVNATAVRKGILPDPIKGSVGIMTGSQFYDITNSITPLHGEILLTAYAGSDTNVMGPLNLRIKVEEIIGRKTP
jgi:uncharacterized protein (DUF3084 family)